MRLYISRTIIYTNVTHLLFCVIKRTIRSRIESKFRKINSMLKIPEILYTYNPTLVFSHKLMVDLK